MIGFPQELDTDEELFTVTDGETDVIAAHHNALKNAIKAIEVKVGINNDTNPASLDFGKLDSSPPDGFSKVRNIYLKEIDEELILIT